MKIQYKENKKSSFTTPECHENPMSLIKQILAFNPILFPQNVRRRINIRSRSEIKLSPNNISRIMFNSNDQYNFYNKN